MDPHVKTICKMKENVTQSVAPGQLVTIERKQKIMSTH